MKEKKELFLLARIEEACEHLYAPVIFDFCDEAMQKKIGNHLAHCQAGYQFDGGFPDAARKMLGLYPLDWDPAYIQWPMMAVRFKRTFAFDHRNVLGELMGLGITRDCLGDICLDDKEAQIVFKTPIAPFLKQNFKEIKGRKIQPVYYEKEKIKPFVLKFKDLNLTVNSPRIDAIIGKIWGLSRQDAVTAVSQGRVRINYEEETRKDAHLSAGDIISFRGKGKAVIDAFEGESKKGKQRLRIKKYI